MVSLRKRRENAERRHVFYQSCIDDQLRDDQLERIRKTKAFIESWDERIKERRRREIMAKLGMGAKSAFDRILRESDIRKTESAGKVDMGHTKHLFGTQTSHNVVAAREAATKVGLSYGGNGDRGSCKVCGGKGYVSSGPKTIDDLQCVACCGPTSSLKDMGIEMLHDHRVDASRDYMEELLAQRTEHYCGVGYKDQSEEWRAGWDAAARAVRNIPAARPAIGGGVIIVLGRMVE